MDGVFDGLDDRPQRPTSGPGAHAENILLLGTDRRSSTPTTGTDARDAAWVPGAQRSDTIMLVHVSADHDSASVISIPRDSWVPIPGYGMGKVNAAFSYGGPTLAVQTIEQLTGVRIDHVALVDWNGFAGIVDALGGVTVSVPRTVTDSARNVTWTAGEHRLDGAAALAYVGQRYGLPGGDLDRVRRQQAVIRALAAETLSQDPISHPVDAYRLLDEVTRYLSVDSEWSTRDMVGLLMSLRGATGSDVTYLTAPVAGFGWEGAQSVVRLDRSTGRELWTAVVTDEIHRWAQRHPDLQAPAIVH
jgi:LCP family protein required for cell wall assembly